MNRCKLALVIALITAGTHLAMAASIEHLADKTWSILQDDYTNPYIKLNGTVVKTGDDSQAQITIPELTTATSKMPEKIFHVVATSDHTADLSTQIDLSQVKGSHQSTSSGILSFQDSLDLTTKHFLSMAMDSDHFVVTQTQPKIYGAFDAKAHMAWYKAVLNFDGKGLHTKAQMNWHDAILDFDGKGGLDQFVISEKNTQKGLPDFALNVGKVTLPDFMLNADKVTWQWNTTGLSEKFFDKNSFTSCLLAHDFKPDPAMKGKALQRAQFESLASCLISFLKQGTFGNTVAQLHTPEFSFKVALPKGSLFDLTSDATLNTHLNEKEGLISFDSETKLDQIKLSFDTSQIPESFLPLVEIYKPLSLDVKFYLNNLKRSAFDLITGGKELAQQFETFDIGGTSVGYSFDYVTKAGAINADFLYTAPEGYTMGSLNRSSQKNIKTTIRIKHVDELVAPLENLKELPSAAMVIATIKGLGVVDADDKSQLDYEITVDEKSGKPIVNGKPLDF